MIIYIDLVLLENIIMNYIILVATSLISKSKISLIKALISATIGGMYSILNYLLELSNICNFLFKVSISVLMIKFTFKSETFQKFFKQLTMFYLTSFTFGGVVFMLLFFVNPQNIVFNGNHLIGTYPIKITLIGGIVGFIIISIVAIIIKNRFNMNNIIYDLEIMHEGKKAYIKVLIDSGNLLKDPITNMDVIVVEKNSVSKILGQEAFDFISKMLKGNLLNEDSAQFYKYKFRLIPFSSLGKENGMLIGFKPEYVKVYGEEENVKRNIIIGIYDGRLSKASKYTGLVGINIFEKERIINENFRKSEI